MSALFRNTITTMASLPVSHHRRKKKQRKRIRPPPPSPQELLELRAAHRTFEGAYFRTALSQLSFSLVILKVFSSEFYSIGALFAAFGALVLAIAIWRRHMAVAQVEEINGALGEGERKGDTGRGVIGGKFRTSGGVVLVISAVSTASYILLMWLVLRIGGRVNKQDEETEGMQAERQKLHTLLY